MRWIFGNEDVDDMYAAYDTAKKTELSGVKDASQVAVALAVQHKNALLLTTMKGHRGKPLVQLLLRKIVENWRKLKLSILNQMKSTMERCLQNSSRYGLIQQPWTNINPLRFLQISLSSGGKSHLLNPVRRSLPPPQINRVYQPLRNLVVLP